MSRQSHSHPGRHRSHGSHASRSMDNNSENYVQQAKDIVSNLNEIVVNLPDQIDAYIPSARSAVAALDSLRFFLDPQRYHEQVWIIKGLQEFAYHDPDTGSIRDIADWCQLAWLKVLRNYREDVDVLLGLGNNWLQRAQAILTRIQNEESNEASSNDSSSNQQQRTQNPLYVEARGLLQPAVDFYARAVRAADSGGTTTGELLASAAEAQMSLGNVTGPPGDEQHFSQAIRYLRGAEAIPGYALSVYLQQYLSDYGRYII